MLECFLVSGLIDYIFSLKNADNEHTASSVDLETKEPTERQPTMRKKSTKNTMTDEEIIEKLSKTARLYGFFQTERVLCFSFC